MAGIAVSLAHFKICEFFADEEQITEMKQKVAKLIVNWKKEVVQLTSFDSFNKGTFYIKSDEASSLYLKALFRVIAIKVKEIIPEALTCTTPHMSIGR